MATGLVGRDDANKFGQARTAIIPRGPESSSAQAKMIVHSVLMEGLRVAIRGAWYVKEDEAGG